MTAMMPRGTSVLPALLIVPSLSLLIAYIWARATRPEVPAWDVILADYGSGEDGESGSGGDLGRYMAYQEEGMSFVVLPLSCACGFRV